MRKFLLIALLFVMPFAVFAQDDLGEIDWDTRGYDLEGETDTEYIVSCPEDGDTYSLWGSEVYTDDSSVCTVAVHMGLITVEDGGEFLVIILDGEEEYEGSEQNDIDSSDWGSWSRSIAVSALGVDAMEIEWGTRGYDLEGDSGTSYAVSCPEDGSTGSLWGTEIYTDDSSICTVAAHMGLITVEDGGEFLVSILDGEEEYEGSEQNDIDSSDWGSWSRSIAVSSIGNVYISDNGTITFEYAEGWTVEEDAEGITISFEDDDIDAEILIFYVTGAVGEQLGVSVDDSAADAMDSVAEAFAASGMEIEDVEEMELGGKDVVFAVISLSGDDLLIAAIETDQGLLLGELSEADNNLDDARSYFVSLIESLSASEDNK